MKKICFYIGIASLAFTGCAKDDVANDIVKGTTITATFENGASTRLNIADDNALTWSAGDSFALFGEGSSAQFTLQSGAGSATAVFTGTAPSTILGAAFPYTDEYNPALSSETLSMTLPAELDQSVNGVCNLPMWAATTSATNIAFKHLAGVLRINFADMPEGYDALIVTASNPISGAFTATTSDEEPVLVSTSEAAADKKVTVEFTAATEDANDNVFYIPLPVGEYESIEISVSNGEDTKNLITYNDKVVERAKVYTASLTYSGVTGTLVTEVDSEEELKASVTAGGYVKLAGDVTLTESINIAEDNRVVLDLNEHTLTFENNTVSAGAYAFRNYGYMEIINGTFNAQGNYFALCLYDEGEAVVNANMKSTNSNVIKVDNGGKLTVNGGKYVSEANPTGQAVRVGNWQTGKASAWELYINGGEFEAKWAGLYIVNNYDGLGENIGVAEIKNATFKGSTSVVDSGVKGSDIVFDKVKNVTISDCTFETIHSETAALSVINDVNITTIEDVYSDIIFTGVSSESELKAAVAVGGSIKLLGDVTLTESIDITEDNNVVLDLNEHTLTFENNTVSAGAYAFRNYGYMEIINGTFNAQGNYFALCLYDEGEAVVNANMKSTNSNVIKVDNGGKLTVNGGKYVSEANPTGQAVRVGNWQTGKASAWELYINGGEFEAKWAGLYIVNNYDGLGENIGVAEIKNATFKGSTSVVDSGVKGSDIVFDKVNNVTILDCTFTTSSIHSETAGLSVINEKEITTVEDVYSTIFN